jgi:serine/threonine-protein kinase
MALGAGTRLGHYEILALIGAGGMGEVYRARDSRLDRPVAIKVLHDNLSIDPQARARFEREARAIAALNHPNIATLHDVGRQDSTDFLVMELIDGETLARRLLSGALPIDRALQYATEIAAALDQAHAHGITHRDLKPGNIMLTRSGLKLLDFGLAKLRGAGAVVAETITAVNSSGVLIGTLQYMAPEQLEGAEADARTDIFAFGVVLYEMVTGARAFTGATSASLMGAILRDTPPPASSIQQVAPPALDRVIATCLAKDPDERWQSIRDVGRELKWIAGGSGASSAAATQPIAAARARRAMPVAAAAALTLGAGLLGAALVWAVKPAAPTPTRSIERLMVNLPLGDRLGDRQSPSVAMSPDGRTLVYVGMRGTTRQLFVRSLDGLEIRALSGTEGATNPFFSWDGQSLGFFADGQLKRIGVTGDASQKLCSAANGLGGSWAPDDTIYFVPFSTSGVWQVSAAGGTARAVTTLNRAEGEVSHRWPQILPDGKALLFTVWSGPGADERHLQLLRLDSGARRLLLRGASTGRYVASGHLLYTRGDAAMAAPFDLATEKLSGEPVALGEHVLDDEGAHYGVSNTGVLAYVPVSEGRFNRRLVWVTPHGVVEPLAAPTRPYIDPKISPDGRSVAFTNIGPVETIWIHNFERGTQTLLTTAVSGSSQAPVWTPDGARVIYRGTRSGLRNLFWRAADGSGDEERLTTSDFLQTPGSVSAGELAFGEGGIWLLPLADRRPRAFLKASGNEYDPQFSPDGHWMAYVSLDSAGGNVFVQPYPGPGSRLQVSTNGGLEPIWSRDGRELYFRRSDQMLAVAFTAAPALAIGAPRLLFEGRYLPTDTGSPAYDVARDGRFLMVQAVEAEQPATSINVVLNWFDDLKRRVPAGKK